MYDWVFTKATINDAIMIWHMGSQWNQILALKFLHPRYFAHISGDQEEFRDIRNLENYIGDTEKIKRVGK